MTVGGWQWWGTMGGDNMGGDNGVWVTMGGLRWGEGVEMGDHPPPS